MGIVLSTPLLRYIAAVHGVWVDGIIYQVSIFRFDGLALGALLAIRYRSAWYSRLRSVQVIAGLMVLDGVLSIAILPFGGMQIGNPLGVAFRSNHTQLFFAAGILAVLTYRGTIATALFRSPLAVLRGGLSIYYDPPCPGGRLHGSGRAQDRAIPSYLETNQSRDGCASCDPPGCDIRSRIAFAHLPGTAVPQIETAVCLTSAGLLQR